MWRWARERGLAFSRRAVDGVVADVDALRIAAWRDCLPSLLRSRAAAHPQSPSTAARRSPGRWRHVEMVVLARRMRRANLFCERRVFGERLPASVARRLRRRAERRDGRRRVVLERREAPRRSVASGGALRQLPPGGRRGGLEFAAAPSGQMDSRPPQSGRNCQRESSASR